MTFRREPLVPGEWYHCYTRGIDGRILFSDGADYRRFSQALYISNSVTTIERSGFQRRAHADVFEIERQNPLVHVGAYALMPNHWHMLLQEVEEAGISRFLQRVGTGYTMYFNKKYEHIGNILVGPFRSKHIGSDSYLRRIVPYIHLNPVELLEPGWKKGVVKDIGALRVRLEKFPYSSLCDYRGLKRPENRILAWSEIDDLLNDQMPALDTLLPEFAEYYENLPL